MFLSWMGLKCLLITLGSCYMSTGYTKSHDSLLHSTDGFSSFIILRGKVLIHSHEPQGLVFWWPPPFTAGRQKQSKFAEPWGGGKAFHMTHFAAPSNTGGVSNKRLWTSTNFGIELQLFRHSFWVQVTFNYCIITFGGWGGATVNIHRSWRVSFSWRNE